MEQPKVETDYDCEIPHFAKVDLNHPIQVKQEDPLAIPDAKIRCENQESKSEGLSIKILRKDGNSLFRSLCVLSKVEAGHSILRQRVVHYVYNNWEWFSPFIPFQICKYNTKHIVRTREDYKMYMGKSGVYGGYVEIIAFSEMYKIAVKVYVISEGQITQPPTTVVGQVMSERSISVLYSGELDNGHFDALLTVNSTWKENTILQEIEEQWKIRFQSKRGKKAWRGSRESQVQKQQHLQINTSIQRQLNKKNLQKTKKQWRKSQESKGRKDKCLQKYKKRQLCKKLQETKEPFRRSKETTQQKERRLQKNRERQRRRRLLETKEQWAARIQRVKERTAIRRSLESNEEREKRLQKNRERIRDLRRQLRETKEQQVTRIHRIKDKAAIRISQESQEEREKRLKKNREISRRNKLEETVTQREKRLEIIRQRALERRVQRAQEQREKWLLRNREVQIMLQETKEQ